MRQQRWIALGAMAVFFALYGVSLMLPCMVLYAVSDSRIVTSDAEIVAELKQESYCWRLGGERLRLNSEHKVVTANGTPFSSAATSTIACTTKIVRPGWQILLWGWLGVLGGYFAWYANILALMTILLVVVGRAPRTTRAFALGAVLLGLDAFRFGGEPSMGMTPGSFLDRLDSGFYVWEISLAALLLSRLIALPLGNAKTSHKLAAP